MRISVMRIEEFYLICHYIC